MPVYSYSYTFMKIYSIEVLSLRLFGQMAMLLLLILLVATDFCQGASLQNPFMRSAPLRCPIDSANTLDVRLFVQDEEECFRHCERTTGCHFYRYTQDSFALNYMTKPCDTISET